MEEKKLNFNAPFLSTRRFSTTKSASAKGDNGKITDSSNPNRFPSLPIYRSDLSSDQVTEPASVPFTWEHIPGKPKVRDVLKHQSEKDFEEQNGVRTQERSLKEELNKFLESEDEDRDVYSDALDTLSPKDSFSLDHSISVVSGYGTTDAKKQLTSFADPQNRDFMMNRFLPAAKAMTLEQSHYASKKQRTPPVASEQLRQIREVVPVEKKLPVNQYDSIIAPHGHHGLNDEESEDEDEIDNISASLSRRGCGLLPQLCFKNSVGMLSPVLGLKAKAHSSTTSSQYHGKPSKASQLKSRIQSVKKLALDSVNKQKSSGGVRSHEQPIIESRLRCGSERFGTNQSDKLTTSRSSSPYRRTGCRSPYRSATTSSPFHPAGFPGTHKEVENLRANRLNKHISGISRSQELLFPRSTRQSSCSPTPVIEKTLYVDTENSPETNSRDDSDFGSPSQTQLSPSRAKTLSKETETGESKSDLNLDQECKSLGNVKLDAVENLSITRGKIIKPDDDEEKITDGCELPPLVLPLPKTPSESWLHRNLPSVNSQKLFSSSYLRSRFHPKKQDPEAHSTSITKWETMVKTSHLHNDHVRYSEELITHLSHQPKT